MSSEPKPVDRGRDPHVGSYRLFVALQEELEVADRRLGSVAASSNALTQHLVMMRQLLAQNPVVLTAETIRQLEASVHRCCLLLANAGTAVTGVSAKVTTARHFARHGIQMGGLRPQPSTN